VVDTLAVVHRGELALGLLVVTSIVLYGYGLSQPEFIYHVSVEGTVTEEEIETLDYVNDYEELSPRDQRIFDRARTRDTSVQTGSWRGDSYIQYDGQYYQISAGGGENFPAFFAGWLGARLAVVAALAFVGLRTVRRVRNR
jgi:hypothetical protein